MALLEACSKLRQKMMLIKIVNCSPFSMNSSNFKVNLQKHNAPVNNDDWTALRRAARLLRAAESGVFARRPRVPRDAPPPPPRGTSRFEQSVIRQFVAFFEP